MFFFQAEDGIRDAQESRGLGDVYKRQVLEKPFGPLHAKVPLPVPTSMMLLTLQFSTPPCAVAPGVCSSKVTSVEALLVQPFVPVTTKL